MTNPFNEGPISPERNPPIEIQNYQPSVFRIADISLGQTTSITTTVSHNYSVGSQIRILIPMQFGSRGLDGVSGFVTAITSATVVLTDIFSLGVDAFISSPSYYTTPAQITAIGDRNNGVISSTGRVGVSTLIPGSFSNIS